MESFWVIEIAACIVAVALHIFTYMLLRDYNGKNVAEFRGRWSLNSIVALLVTVVKIAAILPVAGCIGQLKWHRFRNFRRLRDMEYFDMASRGMFGSLHLLLHLRFWYVVIPSADILASTFRHMNGGVGRDAICLENY
jgi:flagellar biosynthesis protein FlhB